MPTSSAPRLLDVPPRHRWILVAIVLAGLVRGLFWAATIEVWSPIDEPQHYSYMAALGEGDVPVIGEDLVPDEVLEVALATAVGSTRSQPFRGEADDERWGAAREQYEAGQPPLYYVSMLAPQRLGSLAGIRSAIFAVRGATVAISLLAVLVAYGLARELFPRRPSVWLLAPTLLVLVSGFNTNLATVTNDALVPAAAAAMIPTARAIRYGLTTRLAVATGVLIGAALLVKSTAVPVPVYVASGVAAAVVIGRHTWHDGARWLGLAAGASVLVYVPWLIWNLAAYGSPSAADEVLSTITGPLQPALPLSPGGIWQHVELAVASYWNGQVVPKTSLLDFMLLDAQTAVWSASVVGASVVGLLRARRRRSTGEFAAIGWLLATAPITLVTFLVIVYATLGGAQITMGRMMYTSLVPLVVLLAGGAVVAFERRVGTVALAGIAALALSFEPMHVRTYIDIVYASGTFEGLTPVVDQWHNDAWQQGATLRFRPPCEAEAVGLTFASEPPAAVVARTGGREQPLSLSGRPDHQAGPPVGVYRLLRPSTEEFEVQPPPTAAAGWNEQDRDPHVAFADRDGDPVARIYCRTEDPAAHRFAQTYAVNHPDWISLGMLRAWPQAWLWIARGAFLLAVVWALTREQPEQRAG
ncbi:MAG: glycosyltransferase family 39 protein [Actinobacteria bacterium]|nr:glycosyltransferase family 39 protein [Actinomycetota bacterium]